MLKTFLNFLEFEKRCSSHTISAYNTDLLQFQSLIATNHSPGFSLENASHTDIRFWIVSLVENNLDARSINRKVASLRAFYKFLLKREIISKDPTVKISPLKTKKLIPQFVEESQMANLLDEEGGTEFIEIRDNLIIEMFYGTGIRLSEIIGLRNGNISSYESVLKVLGKRSKERVIPINAKLMEIIKLYNEAKYKQFPHLDHDFFIVTKKGMPAYPEMAYHIVKRKLNSINNLDRRSPHILRHTFATHLLDKGADLNAIKDLLGHSSLAATQVYTHNSLEKLKAIFNQAHPRAQTSE